MLDFPSKKEGRGLLLNRDHVRSNRRSAFLSAKVCWSGSQLSVSVVLRGEAVIRVDEMQGSLVVAQQGLLLLL